MAMAAKDMEGVLRRDRCAALPTPPHGGALIGDAPRGDIPWPPEKTNPNYLRPTICSSHCTSCHYPKNQQHRSQPPMVPTPAAAASSGKRLLSKALMQKACPAPRAAKAPPPSSGHKPAICKDPGSEKASKPRGLPKATTKAKPVDVQDHTKVTEAEALRSALPKNRKAEDGPIRGSEASPEPAADVVDASKKPRTRARSMSMSSIDLSAGPRKPNLQGGKKAAGNESKAAAAEGAASKRQEAKKGKESPPAKNAVKEESAASKLAARRNKVKALVGAFETALSLHETEKQPSTQQNEEVAEPAKSRSATADEGRGPQETKVTPEGEGRNQDGEEETAGGGQREVGEESKNGPSEEEEEENKGVDSTEARH